MSALELAGLIRRQEVSPVEIIQAHIDRLEETHPALNALIENRFDRALREAEDLSRQILRSHGRDLSPLAGVPFTVKEIFAVKGFRRTAGSVHRRDEISDFNSTAVQRLLDAGAILLGTTNVPELGFWFECENPVYGRTNNPYDLERTSGGSSGGEGALVGVGASPFGLGSDIGGSIRMPAGFCGVFGHKPSRRRVPLTGHFPFSLSDMNSLQGMHYPLTCTGLLARRSSDLRSLLKTIEGPDGHDQEIRIPSPLDDDLDLRGRRVYICEDPVFHLARRAEDDVVMTIRKVRRFLEGHGANIVELDPKFFVRATELWFAAIRSHSFKPFLDLLSPDQPLSFPKEFINFFRGRGQYTLPSLTTALLEKISMGLKNDLRWQELLIEVKDLQCQFREILAEENILVFPTHPRPPPRHRAPWLSPFDFIYTAVFNIFDGPATACPIGINPDGLPRSVQIIASEGRDDLTLAIAELLESAFGGWTPPQTSFKNQGQ